jgi:ParB/RepB/Spo0J family partition protein
MVARAKKSVEVAPLNGDVFPASDGPMLQFIALDAIQLVAQVRTFFDVAALAELAEDIKVRGMLQPVVLRSPVDGRYQCIAGERRIRAARIAGLSAVPALVGDVTEDQAEDMQLAENIQREDLGLGDVAAAVRRLYDRLGTVARVAQRVKKSDAWVSKRLAVSYDDFDWRARKLLEDGVTEDIELLQCVMKVAALDQREAGELDRGIRAGTAGRKEARAVLAKLKKKPVASAKPGAVEDESGPGAPSGPAFDGRVVLWELVEEMRSEECRAVADMVAEFDEGQQAAVLAIARNDYECGAAMIGCDALSVVRRVGGMNAVEHLEDWSVAAFTLGAFGMPFELGALLAEVRLALP